MAAKIRRKTPEEYLRECQAEEEAAAPRTKGHLKIFLGYASGVGKSFRMLDEARRRRERGEDVVVGAMQSNVAAEVEPLLRKLEVIPLKTVGVAASINVDALIRKESCSMCHRWPCIQQSTRIEQLDALAGRERFTGCWNSRNRLNQYPIRRRAQPTSGSDHGKARESNSPACLHPECGRN